MKTLEIVSKGETYVMQYSDGDEKLIKSILPIHIRRAQNGYISATTNSIKYKTGVVARILMNCPDDMEVDHIDRNSLNNQRENLRVVGDSQQMVNRKLPNKFGIPYIYLETSSDSNTHLRVNCCTEGIPTKCFYSLHAAITHVYPLLSQIGYTELRSLEQILKQTPEITYVRSRDLCEKRTIAPVCTACGKEFGDVTKLKRHQAENCKEIEARVEVPCSKGCGELFSSGCNMKKHAKQCTGTKPEKVEGAHKCKCGKSYAHQSGLDRHLRNNPECVPSGTFALQTKK